jgi:hypothetical protein
MQPSRDSAWEFAHGPLSSVFNTAVGVPRYPTNEPLGASLMDWLADASLLQDEFQVCASHVGRGFVVEVFHRSYKAMWQAHKGVAVMADVSRLVQGELWWCARAVQAAQEQYNPAVGEAGSGQRPKRARRAAGGQ